MTAESTAETVTADTSTDSTTTETATQTTTEQSSQVTPPEISTETPQIPEAYEFSMPEGMELDQGAVDRFTPVFKEAGLTQEAASKLVAAYAEHLAELGGKGAEAFESAYAERRQSEISSQIEADTKALKNDPEIGGANFDRVKADVMRFIGEQGTPEFRQFIEERGIGNNPEYVRMLHRAIRYTPIDQGETPAGAGGAERKSPEQVLYGKK